MGTPGAVRKIDQQEKKLWLKAKEQMTRPVDWNHFWQSFVVSEGGRTIVLLGLAFLALNNSLHHLVSRFEPKILSGFSIRPRNKPGKHEQSWQQNYHPRRREWRVCEAPSTSWQSAGQVWRVTAAVPTRGWHPCDVRVVPRLHAVTQGLDWTLLQWENIPLLAISWKDFQHDFLLWGQNQRKFQWNTTCFLQSCYHLWRRVADIFMSKRTGCSLQIALRSHVRFSLQPQTGNSVITCGLQVCPGMRTSLGSEESCVRQKKCRWDTFSALQAMYTDMFRGCAFNAHGRKGATVCQPTQKIQREVLPNLTD